MAESNDNAGVYGIAQQEQMEAVAICRAVYGGTLVLRSLPEYLPQWDREEEDAYERRLAQAVAFNAMRKTTRSLKGIAFRDPPTFGEDVEDEVLDHLENADLAGRHVNVLLGDQFLDKLIDGHVLTLVDWHGPEGARSRKDELGGEARPYWTTITKGQVRRARPRGDGGRIILGSFAYDSREVISVGSFGEKEVTKIRQFDVTGRDGAVIPSTEPLPPAKLRRVLYRSWVQMDEGGEWKLEEEGRLLGERMDEIPVRVDYAARTGFHRSDPTFVDLALENLRHWQLRSDRDSNLHVVSVPVMNLYGVNSEEVRSVTVGATIGFLFPKGRQIQGTEYTEARGHGLAHTREELLDIQQRMAAMGLSMLERQSRSAETARAKELDQRAQDSELASLAITTADFVEELLVLHSKWLGREGGGSCEMSTDYLAGDMSPELFDKYLKAVGEGAMSLETMWDRLVSGNLLPETFDPELERERIAAAGTATLEAMAEVAALQGKDEEEPEDEEPEDEEDEDDGD